MHRYALLAFVILVGIIAVLAWAASTPGPVSSCMVIDEPGDYYLDRDIVGANPYPGGTASCIRITSSDVNFDCKGHNITNDGTSSSIGIFVGGQNENVQNSNVTVQNCIVKNYENDFFDRKMSDSVFKNNNASADVTNQWITDNGGNIIFGYFICVGFDSQNSNSNRYEGNSVSNCEVGFAMNSSDNVFANNIVTHNYIGFSAVTSTGNNFRNNNIVNNIGGIELSDSSFNNITNNNISNSLALPYTAAVIAQSVWSFSENNTFEGNIVNGTWIGFSILGGLNILTNNKISNLKAISNTSGLGIQLYSDKGSILTSNEIINIDGSCLEVNSPNNNIVNNIIHDCGETGITVRTPFNNISGNSVYRTGSIGIFFLENANNNTISGNTVHDNNASSFIFSGGVGQNKIIGNTAYKSQLGFEFEEWCFDNDVSDNVVYQTEKDCIEFKRCNNNNIINNTGFSCDLTGLILIDSTNNLISGNRFFNNLFGGIVVFNETRSTIVDNVVYGNNPSGMMFFGMLSGGILVGGGKNNVIRNNIVYNNSQFGIGLESVLTQYPGTTENIISWNKVSNSSLYGIYVDSSDNNNFSNNEIFDQRKATGTYMINSTGTVLENEHFYRNGFDFTINSTIQTMDIKLKKVEFDAPAGIFENHTTLSINDTLRKGDSYSIRWATNSTKPPEGRFSVKRKYVNMSTSVDLLIDAITWHWNDADTEGAIEDSFELWTYNGSWNIMKDFIVNTTTNSLNVSNVNASFYGLLYANATAGDCQFITISLNFTPGCDQNTVALTAANSPLSLANITVLREGNIIASGSTDSMGKFFFNGTGASADIYVNKLRTATTCYSVPGAGKFSVNLKSPADCGKPGCDDTTDCPSGQVCTSGICTTPPECTKNEDCAAGNICINGHCARKEPQTGGCVSDDNCTVEQYCFSGNCTEVVTETCGVIRNHAWIPYECCADSDCTSGKACQDNKCAGVSYDLTGPSSAYLGDNITLTAYRNSQPYANAKIIVTNPVKSTDVLTTDASGNAMVNLTQTGAYVIDLQVNNNTAKTLVLTSLPKQAPSGQPLTIQGLVQIGLLLAFILLVGAVMAFLVYYFFIGGKKVIRRKRR